MSNKLIIHICKDGIPNKKYVDELFQMIKTKTLLIYDYSNHPELIEFFSKYDELEVIEY